VSAERRSLWLDESGAAMLEFTAAVVTFFVILFGVIEFSYAFYQWNAATKAMQQGARLAAVSEPAVVDFRDISGITTGVTPGDPMPDFEFTCAAGVEGCDDNALRLIVFGRCDEGEECELEEINGSEIPVRSSCNARTTSHNAGMCNMFPRVNGIDKIEVSYEYTGLGYAGRPGGPVPTITMKLINMNFDFILLAAFLPDNSLAMPNFATTVTGEDLNAMWSSS
jgi:hypothetical protein